MTVNKEVRQGKKAAALIEDCSYNTNRIENKNLNLTFSTLET